MIITVTTNPTVDFSAEVDELVAHRKLRADISAFAPGGGGVNVARVLHQLGVPCTAVVAVGGLPGQIVLDGLARQGIHTRAVRTAADSRWAEMVRDRSNGAEYRLIAPAHELADDEWRACVEAVDEVAAAGRVDHVVVSGSTHGSVAAPFVRAVADVCERIGARLVVDGSGAVLEAAVDARAFLVKPSRRELAALTGVAPHRFDPVQAARAVHASGVANVLVSLGRDGAVLVSDEGEVHLHPPAVDVVSTVGAGDATVAGLLAGLAAGSSLVEAARLGVATGTATCLHPAGRDVAPGDIERIAADVLVT